MNKVGRKALLTTQEQEQLQADYTRYQRVTERYQRMVAKISPQSLGRRFNISTSTVIDYARGRHKGRDNYARTAAGQQALA